MVRSIVKKITYAKRVGTIGTIPSSYPNMRGKYNFIIQDNGEEEILVLPGSCPGFDFVCPAAGTRVAYDVGAEPKTGRIRAECVEPESELLRGTIASHNGRSGFI